MANAREAAEEIRGMPDLICFYRGRSMAIETKTEIGKLTTWQEYWRGWLGTIVIRDEADGCRALDEWKAICDT